MSEAKYKLKKLDNSTAVYSMPENSTEWWLTAVFYSEAELERWQANTDLLAEARRLVEQLETAVMHERVVSQDLRINLEALRRQMAQMTETIATERAKVAALQAEVRHLRAIDIAARAELERLAAALEAQS